jgi:acetyl-CoA C-acetyltransferase
MAGRVAIVAMGQSTYEPEKRDQHLTELVHEVVRGTLDSVNATPRDVDNIVSCSQDFLDGRTISNRTIPEAEGGFLKPEAKVAADGTQAVFFGMMRILSGKYRIGLVLAHCKMSEGSQNVIANAMFDPFYQQAIGLDELNAAALAMRRYLHLSKATEEHCAAVAAKAFNNARRNPCVFRGAATSATDVLASPMLASPIRAGMAMVPADGACAMLLAHEDVARRLTDKPVWITGAGCCADAYFLGDRDLGRCESLTLAARKAYRMAGITNPGKEIDLVELCEFYSFQELLWSEGLGLADPGEGAALFESGRTALAGDLPINPSGGVLGGNPLCVAGMTRVIECARQIRGEAGEHQKAGVRTAVAQGSTGPCGQSQCVIVLSAD